MSQGIDTKRRMPTISLLVSLPHERFEGGTYQINNLATAPPHTRPPNPSPHPSFAIRYGRTRPEKRAIGT
jgi:hypothetical protein